MGLLDDAIREHLELKRRHGADPDEVARQEREALGAPVRGEFAKPAEAGAAPPRSPTRPPRDAAPADEPERRRPEPTSRPPTSPRQSPRSRRPRAAPGYDEDPWLVEDPAEGRPSEALPEPDARAARRDGEGEDVLEETPEFLQETPEHDRLWFEQKPPRDFDWDK